MVTLTYLSWSIPSWHGDQFDGTYDQKLEQHMMYLLSIIMDGDRCLASEASNNMGLKNLSYQDRVEGITYTYIYIFTFITVQYSTLRGMTLHNSAVQYIPLNFITLQYILLRYVA